GLDRVAGTHDCGRAVLARWRQTGRIPTTNPDETGSTVASSTADTVVATVPARTPDTSGNVPDISGDPVRPFETHPAAADRLGPVAGEAPAGHTEASGRAAA